MKICICYNDETICSGHTDWRTSAWEDEIAAEFTGAAGRVISDAIIDGLDIEYEASSQFSDWHGGRHRQFASYDAGLIVCHGENPTQEIKDLCDKANHAGVIARDKRIAELEADHAKALS